MLKRIQGVALRRRGISLVEVMISIGIAMIGLLGISMLMPLAARQADHSNTVDRGAEVGRRAFHELYVRGMHDFDNWLNPNGTGVASTSDTVCIDPRMIAQRIFANSDNPSGVSASFPSAATRWDGNGSLQIARYTLRASHPSKQNASQTQHAMRLGQANELFTGRDELIFNDKSGNDKTVPPEQQLVEGKKRDSLGRFSWFFTASPVSRYDFSLYKFSVVVIKDRDPAFPVGPEERVAGVTFHTLDPTGNYAIGGGDVTLKVKDAGDTSSSSEIDAPVGSWVCMMGRRIDVAADGGSTADKTIQWYRVASAQLPEFSGSDTTWIRRVTLDGPDWKIAATGTPAANADQCVLVRGACAVYEKVMRLSTPSLYRP